MEMNISIFDNIDSIDRQIIQKLQQDGRQSYTSIAAELNLAPSTVQQRVNRLISSGILGIHAMIHPANVPQFHISMIAIKADGTRLQEIAQEIGQMPEARWVVVCAGQYDILTEIVCRDSKHLLNLLSHKIATISGVRETVTFPYLEIAKRTYEWNPLADYEP